MPKTPQSGEYSLFDTVWPPPPPPPSEKPGYANSRTYSNQFDFVRLIAATKLAKAALWHHVYAGNKSLRQNINEPMREHHMVSHIELEN